MRFFSIVVCVCLATAGVTEGQDFVNAEAKAAKEQYENALADARKKYADSLDEAAKKAFEKDQLEEAIKIKKVAEDLRNNKPAGNAKAAGTKVLWKHKGGYFEKLNDGYWVERVPDGVAHIFAQGAAKDGYIEISRTTGSKTLVRLYDDRCTVLFQGKNGFRPLYKGGWADRN